MSAAAIVSRAELANAVTAAALGLSRRPVVPVLAGMLVTVSAGTLELAAFDYETSARYRVQADTDGSGTVLVTGAGLAESVKGLPKGKTVQAMLTVNDDGLVIECDGAEAALTALPREEYPQLPDIPGHSGDIDASAFAAAVARVSACAGRDDTLPMLLCVHVTSGNGNLNLEASDRYRAAFEAVGWTGPDGHEVLLSAVQLAAFARRMRKDGKVSLHFGDEFAALADGTLTMTMRPQTSQYGKYPDFAKFIRDSDETVVTADAKTLAAAVTAVGAMVERNGRLGFGVAGGRATITATRAGKVASTRGVPVQVDGPDVESGFCPAYLASLLGGVKGDVRIGFADGTSKRPVMVQAGAFTGVIMPIRRPDES